METSITLTGEYIKLDALLKATGVADSGGEAKHMILEGLVSLNGQTVHQRGKKIRQGDVVEVSSQPPSRIIVQ